MPIRAGHNPRKQNTVKILAPVKERNSVLPLIEAGADELYCGYISSAWKERFTELEFERKGFGSNFTEIKELRAAVETAHKKKVPVFLALNGLYVASQYPLLMRIVKELSRVDLDGYIVADLGLLLTLRKLGFRKQIHISTGGTAFNTEAARFYRELGASRIILDRQVTIEAMSALAQNNPDIDFEAFILNTMCVYIDGFCTFLHTYSCTPTEDLARGNKNHPRLLYSTLYDIEGHSDACTLRYSVQSRDDKTGKLPANGKYAPVFYKQLTDGRECGACALYDIGKAGIKSVKIVGRQLPAEQGVLSVRFIHAALAILRTDAHICRQDFIARTKALYKDFFQYTEDCRGNNCFHPRFCAKA